MAELIRLDGPAEGVATLTLDRPAKRNALSVAMREELSDALEALAVDDRVRAVVLTGAGEVFCAGFDLKEFQDPDPDFQQALWASSDRYHRAVLEFPLPLLAAVNGPAIAGGFDLAVMCDIRLASATARFSHPEIRFGDVVYGPLHDAVGAAVARDLCLSGREIDAGEALALHVVTTVCDPHELATMAAQRAAMVAGAPRDVLVRTKSKMSRRAGVVPGATLDL
jgi:enoyl-CoA hydratase